MYLSALRVSAIVLFLSLGILWQSRSSPVADRQAAGRQGGRQASKQASKQAGRQAGQTGEKSSMSAQSQKIEFPVFKSMVLRLCFELEIFQIFWPERCLAFLEGILRGWVFFFSCVVFFFLGALCGVICFLGMVFYFSCRELGCLFFPGGVCFS